MKLLRILSIILLLVLTLSAFAGGFILMTDPDGHRIQLPLDYLKNSPFKDYLFPGLVLLLMNGVSGLIVLVTVIIKHKYYPWFTIYQGVIIIGWITVQMIMLQVFYFLQFVFIAIGITLITSGIIQISSKNPLTKKSKST